MSPAEVARLESQGKMSKQEISPGQGGDPSSQGKFRKKLKGPQMMSFGCTEIFEVMHLVTCRNPE